MSGPLPVAVTMGEPAGIGPDIALLAWLRRDPGDGTFFVIAAPVLLAARAKALGASVPLAVIAAPEEAAKAFGAALPVLPIALNAEAVCGRLDRANAAGVLAAIDLGVDLARAGRVAAIVTNPIQKSMLYDEGFRHPGHTEYLQALTGASGTAMMLACPGLRVVPVTVHLSVAEAVRALSAERIVACGELVAASLAADFGIARPRLAVAALNPHAGEDGAMGREEIDIIAPAVAALRARAIEASGPAPADTLFHAAARANYDAALCMYHDQALIPLKTIDFDRGVNITLGLPIVRTSPDHGVALALAGTGRANPASLIAAIETARAIAGHRLAAASAVQRA